MDVSQENDETSTPVLQIPRQPLAEEDLQIISDQATVNGVFPPPFNTDISEKSTKTSVTSSKSTSLHNKYIQHHK